MSVEQQKGWSAADEDAFTVDERELRRVAISSLLGTSMEWYDYFIYGILAALVFNSIFFPEFDPVVGTVLAFLTFAVGFVARPLGGMVFGHLGDRIGRKKTLILTIVIIGLATGAVGLLPTYHRIGLAAPILLAVLRFIQGLSVGGEWSGAVLMAVEHAPPRKKAIYGAMPQFGSPVGTIASSGIVALVTLLPAGQFETWGWRVPFLLAFPMLGVAIYLRLRVEESPVFVSAKLEETAKEERHIPVIELLRHAWGQMLLVVMTALFASGGFFLFTTYAVNYGTKVLGMASWVVLLATMGGAVLEAGSILISGRLADRYTPWKVVFAGGVLAVLCAAPLTLMLGSGQVWLAALAIALGIGLLGIPYGPIGSLFSQLFDGRYRYSGVAISYNLAGMVGGFVPSIALALQAGRGDTPWVIGLLFAVILGLTALGAFGMGRVLRAQGRHREVE
ncbi:Na+/melibiose symporter-like transporter [Nostocoides japonicum T1-X7]|uniref:Putative proline/betaine transporter n=1 Tax=Nostocoides japonicum T1-X7 TaxID=1194083 RepID=A0A077M506_9MICO|nr:MFS transporter [Tetrasphaera japonica]CCH79160.1 Na+/melibiose symporter-like transporter [Tetrasphaera japonica T1-X7]